MKINFVVIIGISPNYSNLSPGPAADISLTDDTSVSTDIEASGTCIPTLDDTSRNIHDTSACFSSDSDVSSLIIGDITSCTTTGIAITSNTDIASTSGTGNPGTGIPITDADIAGTRKRMKVRQKQYIVKRRRKN